MLHLFPFGILSDKLSCSQNDNKSGTLAGVVPGFFASDNLNAWDDERHEKETLGALLPMPTLPLGACKMLHHRIASDLLCVPRFTFPVQCAIV